MILDTYTDMSDVERENEDGLAAQVFDNKDFGYYKVNIERPLRLAAQFSAERIETLRYDKTLMAPMEYAYEAYGEKIYSHLQSHVKDIIKWCEDNDISLSTKHKKSLSDPNFWQGKEQLVQHGTQLMAEIGKDTYKDFNAFAKVIDDAIKTLGMKLSASEKKTILSAITEYDETAEKVVKRTVKLTPEKLDKLCTHHGCKANELAYHGYYATDKKNEYLQYETSSDHRDTENVPLGESIQDYFLAEVLPHVDEAWIK